MKDNESGFTVVHLINPMLPNWWSVTLGFMILATSRAD